MNFKALTSPQVLHFYHVVNIAVNVSLREKVSQMYFNWFHIVIIIMVLRSAPSVVDNRLFMSQAANGDCSPVLIYSGRLICRR